jgi:membrane-associated phospholipid phosphatase
MMQAFWADILAKDRALFSMINGEWTCSLFDQIMPWIRTSINWFPLYIVLLAFIIYKWKKSAWKWVLLAAVNVTLTDQISSSIFKPFFQRLRPCVDPALMHKSRLLLEHCSGGFSFTSSHAANHFGIAIFIIMTLQPLFKNYRFLFLIWAAMIAYAQVYVGVHYPLDIIGGSCIGILVGYFNGKLFNYWQSKTFPVL